MTTLHQTALAFVTGAGSGIGRATCQVLAERGVVVVAADINKQAVEQTVKNLKGSNHTSVQLDVRHRSDVTAAIADVTKKYSSPPTIAVNCAGLMHHGSLLETTEETYNRIFDVNVKGTFWVTQAVCKELLAAKKNGRIVNVSSIAKHGFPFLTLYGASKGALESFTRCAAKEFGPHGIRINVIAPGYTDTSMMEPFPEDVKKEYIEINSLRRSAKPEEIAEVIAFLTSDKSSYMNGTSMYVDGGFV